MSLFLYETLGNVCRITLNRPESRNAINREMIKQFPELLDRAEQDPSIGAVVIAAAGDKAFSAGYDIKQSITQPIIDVVDRRAGTAQELASWMKIWDLKKPVIAQVQGHCIGMGLHLAFMCDLIIASEDARFGEPELAFSYIPSILIEPWKMPMNKLREMLYLGEFLTARELHACGTVNRVVEPGQLAEETLRVAHKIASMPHDSLAMLKYQINKTYEMQGFKSALDFGVEMFNLCRINQAQTQEEFNEIVREKGMKAALAWKAEQRAAAEEA